MSFQALAWAAKQRPGNLAAKMVLLGLANWADEDGRAYPSLAALVEFGDMDRKTAIGALDRLIELGLISDDGERAGRTRQIKVYQLNLETVPKTEPSRKRNSSVFPVKEYRKRNPDTIKEPTSEAKASSVTRTRGKSVFELPDWVPAEPWAAFDEMRRAMHRVFTDPAKKAVIEDLEKLKAQGHDPGACLMLSVINSYRRVYPPRDSGSAIPSGKPVSDIDRQLVANYAKLQAGEISDAEFEAERGRLDLLERDRIAACGRSFVGAGSQ